MRSGRLHRELAPLRCWDRAVGAWLWAHGGYLWLVGAWGWLWLIAGRACAEKDLRLSDGRSIGDGTRAASSSASICSSSETVGACEGGAGSSCRAGAAWARTASPSGVEWGRVGSSGVGWGWVGSGGVGWGGPHTFMPPEFRSQIGWRSSVARGLCFWRHAPALRRWPRCSVGWQSSGSRDDADGLVVRFYGLAILWFGDYMG